MLRSRVMDGGNDMEPTPVTKLTYDDFVHFPDDGQRHELIDGIHYVTPSPNRLHQRVSRRLFRILEDYFAPRHIGEVFYAPLDVILSPLQNDQPVTHVRGGMPSLASSC